MESDQLPSILLSSRHKLDKCWNFSVQGFECSHSTLVTLFTLIRMSVHSEKGPERDRERERCLTYCNVSISRQRGWNWPSSFWYLLVEVKHHKIKLWFPYEELKEGASRLNINGFFSVNLLSCWWQESPTRSHSLNYLYILVTWRLCLQRWTMSYTTRFHRSSSPFLE